MLPLDEGQKQNKAADLLEVWKEGKIDESEHIWGLEGSKQRSQNPPEHLEKFVLRLRVKLTQTELMDDGMRERRSAILTCEVWTGQFRLGS